MKQAEAGVVPSSSLVEVKVEVEVGDEVEVEVQLKCTVAAKKRQLIRLWVTILGMVGDYPLQLSPGVSFVS